MGHLTHYIMCHIILLNHLKELTQGTGKLFVGVSTDTFNLQKNKIAYQPYSCRANLLLSLRAVDFVFPEECWEQKIKDIRGFPKIRYGALLNNSSGGRIFSTTHLTV